MKKNLLKKISVIVAMVLLTAGFTSCGGASKTEEPSNSDTAQTADETAEAVDDEKENTASTEDVFIGATLYNYSDTMEALNRDQIIKKAEEEGFEIEWTDGANDQALQINQVDAFLAQGANAIICNIIDYTAASSVIEKCAAEDVPLVFMNHEPSKEDLDSYDKVWSESCDSKQAGELCGQSLGEYFKTVEGADRNGDGECGYVILQGKSGNTDATYRTQYATSGLEGTGVKANLIATDFCPDWTKVEAYDKMMSWISSAGIENIDGVFANNDTMALGAIEALQTHGYNTGESTDPSQYIPVYGVDGIMEAKEAIQQKKMHATAISPNADIAISIVNCLKANLNGEEVTTDNIGYRVEDEKYIYIDYVLGTQENITEYQ